MPGAVVGLYCAVVGRFDLLVSTRTMAARESHAAFNPRAESLRTWLGALNLGLVEGRQREPDSGAERAMASARTPSPVGLNDGAAYQQADHHDYKSRPQEGRART